MVTRSRQSTCLADFASEYDTSSAIDRNVSRSKLNLFLSQFTSKEGRGEWSRGRFGAGRGCEAAVNPREAPELAKTTRSVSIRRCKEVVSGESAPFLGRDSGSRSLTPRAVRSSSARCSRFRLPIAAAAVRCCGAWSIGQEICASRSLTGRAVAGRRQRLKCEALSPLEAIPPLALQEGALSPFEDVDHSGPYAFVLERARFICD